MIDQYRGQVLRELHDRIGASLALALRRLELLGAARSGAEAADIHLDAAVAAVTEALSRTRELTSELRTPLVRGSLAGAIEEFAATMAPAGSRQTIATDGRQEWVPASIIDEVFLMVRECLRNVYAHADAHEITVCVAYAPHEIRAETADDGRGFDPAGVSRAGHFGLACLRERAAALGGAVYVESEPGAGTTVTVWIPVRETSR